MHGIRADDACSACKRLEQNPGRDYYGKMLTKRTRVAILDNAVRPWIYTPVRHWSKFLHVEWEAFTAREERFPSLNGDFSHIIITGSEASIMEREPWVDSEIEFIRRAAQKNVPMLGSCYGHQLLAVALAGAGSVRRSPTPELGWLTIDIRKKGDLLGDNAGFDCYTLHFDEVVDLDDRFEVLASTGACAIHAFRRKARPFWGIQAHPEIDIDDGRILLRNLLTLELPHSALYRGALAQEPRDSGLITQIMDFFLSA